MTFQTDPKRRRAAALQSRGWTLGLTLVILFVNAGLFHAAPDWAQSLTATLQFDRAAILHGEVWRLVTGNLVHWSPEHLALDVMAFLVVGFLYEPIIRRAYPYLVVSSCLVVGGALLLFQPDLALYRGLSGVDSAQFAAALGIECLMASREKRRWLWVAPASAIFLSKIAYECATGRMFFGTESLGDIGLPVPLAHAAGVATVLAFVLLCWQLRRCDFEPGRHRTECGEVALWHW